MNDHFKVDFAKAMLQSLKTLQPADPKIQKMAQVIEDLNQAAILSEEISALGSSEVICQVLNGLSKV